MATRRERVVLDLQDDFTGKMTAAAGATALLRRELNSLSGTAVQSSRSARDVDKSVAGIGTTARRSGADIDRLSGRLRLLTEIAAVLGPGLIPIGAVGIPAITGLASALGFAAVAGGTAAVAFQGVGDALDTMRKAQLEPTTANLEAARQAMQQIGPHARTFVRELMEMGPALREVRDAAAAGLFPGMVEALDSVESALPRVASLFRTVGEAVGELAADSAESLAGPRWADFFGFIEREAPAALTELGAAVGSVAHGFSELWEAFGPLNRDFNSWVRDAAAAFDEWATGLSRTEGFEDFVDYVRENGPRVAGALGSLGDALVQVVQAAAPLGGPVLDAISSLADALAAVANSPVGPTLVAAAAGLSALRLAGRGFDKLFASVGAGLERIGVAGTQTTTALSRVQSAATKAVGALAALSVLDTLQTQFEGLDSGLNAVTSNLMSLGSGRVDSLAGEFGNLAESFKRLTDPNIAQAFQDDIYKQFPFLGSDSRVDEAVAQFEALDGALQNILSTQGPAKAQAAFDRLADSLGLSGAQVQELLGLLPGFEDAMVGVGRAVGSAGLRDLLFGPIEEGAREAEAAVRNLSGALAGLEGYLNRREAMRAYEDSLRDITKALKDGFSREDAAVIDAVGRNIISVADSLARKPGMQRSFIREATRDLEELAANSGPKARAEIEGILKYLRRMGNTKTEPEMGLDDSEFRGKAGDAQRLARAFDTWTVEPTADLNAAPFARMLGVSVRDLRQFDSDTAKPGVQLDLGAFNRASEYAKGKVRDLDNDKAVPKADLDTGLFTRKERTVSGDLTSLGRRHERPTISVNDHATSILTRINALIGGINSKSVTITTTHRTVGNPYTGGGRSTVGGVTNAAGGFHEDGLRAFAGGGWGMDGNYYPRQPMLVPGGANILWGEKETGWEAYISGNPSERDRNLSILGMAADRLGASVIQAANGRTVGFEQFGGGPRRNLGGGGGRRSLDERLEIAQFLQEIRDLRRSLNADGRDRLKGMDRRIANLRLEAAKRELRVAKRREQIEERQAARQELRETRGNLRNLISGGLSGIEGLVPGPEPTTADRAAQQIADFRRQVVEAGGTWTKALERWGKGLVAAASEYDDVSAALERETAARDALTESLRTQQAQLDDLERTMQSYSDSVGGNFRRNPFGQSITIPGTGGGGSSPELAAAEAQLIAIRSSATGDSVAAAAQASRLLARIGTLREAAEAVSEDRTLTGLDAFRKTLEEDTQNAERMTAALEALVGLGLDTTGDLGGLFKELAASGDLLTAEQMAALTAAQVDELEKAYAAREEATAELAAYATHEVYGQQHQEMVALVEATNGLIATHDASIKALTAEMDTLGAEVRAGAQGGVAGLQPQLDAIRQSIRNLPRQQKENDRKRGKGGRR